MAPKFTLYYFDAPGRAEAIRMAFRFGGVDFVDERLSRADFMQLKPSFPNGQVPCLKFENGQMLSQSAAILQYVAKLTGLYPEDPFEAAKSSEVLCFYDDLQNKFGEVFKIPDAAAKAKALEELTGKFVPMAFSNLNAMISKNGTAGFSSGGRFSFSDLAIFCVLDAIKSNFFGLFPNSEFISDFKALQAVYDNVKMEQKFFAPLDS